MAPPVVDPGESGSIRSSPVGGAVLHLQKSGDVTGDIAGTLLENYTNRVESLKRAPFFVQAFLLVRNVCISRCVLLQR